MDVTVYAASLPFRIVALDGLTALYPVLRGQRMLSANLCPKYSQHLGMKH